MTIIGNSIYISRTFNMIYFLDEEKNLREIPLGRDGEVSSYLADVTTAKLAVIKGRTREASHNRVTKNELMYHNKRIQNVL